MASIDQFRSYFSKQDVKFSAHATKNCSIRKILTTEIEEAVADGEIIEEYPEDTPFPSCLILGFTKAGRPIHIVVADAEDYAFLITVYEPNVDKKVFEDDLKTRIQKESD